MSGIFKNTCKLLKIKQNSNNRVSPGKQRRVRKITSHINQISTTLYKRRSNGLGRMDTVRDVYI